ncbi:MAG: hypothetical protein ACYS80_15915, partial [Planctomycetota bacterium]
CAMWFTPCDGQILRLRLRMTEKPASLAGICGEMERKIYINLKKQSQFAEGQKDVKCTITSTYGDFDG